ncbi:MAG: hypothetical protein KatS3mg126_2534 [Lysobacteraceae bacterium]|nr:MAG: hypothetical protein KatS3mg126_2534 [Xanthomonadaceae bacterium]
MRRTVFLFCAGLLLAAGGAEAQQKKLYRWTDKDGKVHYSDHVPPEAIENARSELNEHGLEVGKVERALTAEERAAQRAAAEAEARQRKAREEQAKADQALLSSYGTVQELDRAYRERFDLVEQALESARVGLQSQEKSLADLLAHAAGLQRQNKPVPQSLTGSIELARRQVAQQREYLATREAEKAAIEAEYRRVREHYLALRAAEEAARAGGR